MTDPSALHPPSASPLAALTGSWKLPAGRALSLRPAAAGELLIARGRAWVTCSGPHAPGEGDLFLEAGDRLPVAAGDQLVIEPWGRATQDALWFSWVPSARPVATPAHRALAQPLSDLRLASSSAWHAGGAVALALARLAWGLAVVLPRQLALPARSRRAA